MLEEKLSLVIVIALGIITLVQLSYYYGLYARFSFSRKKKSIAMQQVPVSVIVVVKDAAGALLKFLPRILGQQYSQFQLVVVNDHSHDDTELLVKEYQNQYDNIKLVNLDSAVSTIRGNKFALSMGIRCASYEHIVITDAECCPASAHWLERMAENFVSQTKIVIGYSSFEKKRNPFNRMLHYDNLMNAMQYFSYAQAHTAYRADLRNVAFTRGLFYAQKGFASHNHISCGEEDIFISRSSNRTNTSIEYSPDSFTQLQRTPTHNAWKRHKMGLYYTLKYNSLKNRFLLKSYAWVNILFYVLLVIAILATMKNTMFLSIVLGIAIVRIVSQYLVFGFAAKKLNEKQTVPFLIVYDVLFALLNPLYYLSAQIYHHKFL